MTWRRRPRKLLADRAIDGVTKGGAGPGGGLVTTSSADDSRCFRPAFASPHRDYRGSRLAAGRLARGRQGIGAARQRSAPAGHREPDLAGSETGEVKVEQTLTRSLRGVEVADEGRPGLHAFQLTNLVKGPEFLWILTLTGAP